ncbi:uncharacterized protein LOC100577071 [Apis mellifera]|uniref:Uncharacterized protein LOC100577071 n=1 Tax=Apis mellifera TaxID=7460 RepID=A0A7M7MMI4_APIME|nr:uncharacterized protein LOC100577071 [Apis mellifera]|eukprot:XP_026298206.1 uncharacterized protein LOC100577071 [Apis mellifera]
MVGGVVRPVARPTTRYDNYIGLRRGLIGPRGRRSPRIDSQGILLSSHEPRCEGREKDPIILCFKVIVHRAIFFFFLYLNHYITVRVDKSKKKKKEKKRNDFIARNLTQGQAGRRNSERMQVHNRRMEVVRAINGKQFGCETRGTPVLHYVWYEKDERQPVPTHLFR